MKCSLELSEVVDGKKLLVVGNGDRATHLSHHYYENVDHIVKFNEGVKVAPHTIWAPTGIFPKKKIKPLVDKYTTESTFYFNFEGRWFPDKCQHIVAPLDWVTAAKEDLQSKMLFSGTLFLWCLLNRCSCTSIEIVGFDCYRNNTLPNPHQKWKAKDRAWLLKEIRNLHLTPL
jgi:hypothetical protein